MRASATKRNEVTREVAGGVEGAIVEGPLSFDLAISPEARLAAAALAVIAGA